MPADATPTHSQPQSAIPGDTSHGFSGFSLRAKFLLAMVLITCGLTISALLVIRIRVTRHIYDQAQRDLGHSSEYLRAFAERRTDLVERMNALVADTPLLKALMTTRDPATIQDGTKALADLSGAQLFLVADPAGKILGMQGSLSENQRRFEPALSSTLQGGRQRDWWLVNGKLYQVVVTPISSGSEANRVDIGVLASGFEIDTQFMREIAGLSDSEVAVGYNGRVVAATLPLERLSELDAARPTGPELRTTSIGKERFLTRQVAFSSDPSSPVLVLLKSYDEATAFLTELNGMLILIGLLAIGAGAGLAYVISNRFTLPLRELLTGVQALEDGQYDYPLHSRGADEAAQLTNAFSRMRETLRKGQEQLLRSARMEALGRLAGGVAHDFNNIVTIISGYGELALDKTSADPEVSSYIQEIRKAGERASGLTRQLLAFSRKQVLQPQPLDLNAVLSNINKMLRVLMGEDVKLVLSQAAKIPTVMADPGQVEQVVLNLCANARDAMPGGGTLTISTNLRRREEVPTPSGDAKSYVELCVTDTGTGMSTETIKHVFEPFFTTKAPGKGTGLGLATVYGIVQQSGGCIDVRSEIGTGTSFLIYLPAVAKTAASVADLPHHSPKAVGSGVVLVVEDEEPVRRLAIAGLADRGYTVLSAVNGREALKLIDAYKQRIDLVLTDVIMPEMGGRELFERLKTSEPHIKVLFMSGYTDRSLAELGLELETALLPKPFTPNSLAKKVQEMLDRGPAKTVLSAD